MDPDRAVRAIASRQHAAFTCEQAIDAGLSRRQIHRRKKDGRYVGAATGTYLIAGAPDSFKQRVMVAVLATGRSAVASHTTAAILLGLMRPLRGPLHVTIPHGSNPVLDRSWVVHQTRSLKRSDVGKVSNIPSTSPMRTIVDLASLLDRPRLEAVVDGALIRGVVELERLCAFVERFTGKEGLGVLRSICADRREGVPESELERCFLRLGARAGLPKPTRQFWIGKSRVDLVFEEQRIVIELDGSAHRTADGLRRDSRRQNRLFLEGWIPLRYTWWDIDESPDEVVAEIREALAKGTVDGK